MERLLRPIFFLLIVACSACAPKNVEQTAAKSMPILPSYKAKIYTLAPTLPRDPLVRELLIGLHYDESLAGAATAISLAIGQDQPLDGADVNWACLRSGWPYPLTGHRQLILPKDSDPAALIQDLQLTPTSRIGVVRARSSESDVWVLLQSEVPVAMNALSMEQDINSTLAIPGPSSESLVWTMADPEGHEHTVSNSILLDQAGEWLLEANSPDGQLYRAAIYVDMDIPETSLISPEDPVSGAEARANQAHRMITESHQLFFDTEQELVREPNLDRSAAIALKAILSGEEISSAELRFEQLGFTKAPRHEIGCTGETVRTCLDGLIWSTKNRGKLLARDHEAIGISTMPLENGQLMMMINLAAD